MFDRRQVLTEAAAARAAVPSRVSIGLWPLAFACCWLLGLAACGRSVPDGSVPVDLRSGYASTRDPKPIETSLYVYADPPNVARKTFRVSGEPPLRFAFPGTYYSLEANLAGGPQAMVGLKVDRRTFEPSVKPRAPERVSIRIYSNVFQATQVPYLGPRSASDPRTLYFRSSIARPIRSDDAVTVYEVSDQSIITDIAGNAGSIYGIDLARRNIVIKPKRGSHRTISHVGCIRQLPRCEAYSFYKGRLVLIFVHKRDMGEVYRIAERTCDLLARYDLDARRTGAVGGWPVRRTSPA